MKEDERKLTAAEIQAIKHTAHFCDKMEVGKIERLWRTIFQHPAEEGKERVIMDLWTELIGPYGNQYSNLFYRSENKNDYAGSLSSNDVLLKSYINDCEELLKTAQSIDNFLEMAPDSVFEAAELAKFIHENKKYSLLLKPKTASARRLSLSSKLRNEIIITYINHRREEGTLMSLELANIFIAYKQKPGNKSKWYVKQDTAFIKQAAEILEGYGIQEYGPAVNVLRSWRGLKELPPVTIRKYKNS